MACDLKIDWATFSAAKYACEKWHYSKVTPVGKLVKIGVWENNVYVGVVLFGRGANNNMLKPFKLKQSEGCELVRVALKNHKTPVSKILSIAVKFLKKSNPKLKLIVSYADKDRNHHGGIYQACNWIYNGLKNAGNGNAFIINGKLTHSKSVHSKGIKQNIESIRKNLDPKATVFFTKGKHQYLFPLDKKIKKEIEILSKPYPKRAQSIESDASSFQGEKDGASPICALHS